MLLLVTVEIIPGTSYFDSKLFKNKLRRIPFETPQVQIDTNSKIPSFKGTERKEERPV